MSGISTNIGLISGIDTGSLIAQLAALERRPITLLESRIAKITQQKTTFLNLSAQLLSLSNAAKAFSVEDLFSSVNASSSNTSVLTAAASSGATPGSYQFSVRRLAQAATTISSGFASADATVGAGQISVSLGPNRVSEPTKLEFLNAFQGVDTGTIKITDRSGNSAEIDLNDAYTINDVVDEINAAAGIDVTAFVQGDGLVLEDNTGVGSITVTDVSGSAAADLGILGNSGGGAQLIGDDIYSLAGAAPLTALNDGLGIGIRDGLDDFQIMRRDGILITVDLSDAASVQDVISAINNDALNADGLLTASINVSGDGILITDTSVGGAALTVTALNGSSAAADLGILGSDVGGVIDGGNILGGINTVMLDSLNGGSGVAAGSITIQDRSGASEIIDLSSAITLADVLDLINSAATVDVTASVSENGTSVVIEDNTGSTANALVIDESGSTTAADLGIFTGAAGVDESTVNGGMLSRQIINENTSLDDLNGGSGVFRGEFRIRNSIGQSAVVDLSQAGDDTLGRVIDEINSRGIGVTAAINSTGDGLVLTDTNGGANAMRVEEVGLGTTAADLGILGTADEATPDVIESEYRANITVEAGDSLSDIADAINAADIGVVASVVDTGSAVNPFRLSLASESTGSNAGINLFTDIEGLGFTVLQEAGDAVLEMGSGENALRVFSSSNTFDQIIPGLTLTASSVSDSPVTITVTEDASAVSGAMSTFVDAFNSALTAIKDATSYDSETEQRGILLGDATIASVQSRLSNSVNIRVSGLANLNSLIDLGIRFSEKGTLGFDEEQFNSVFQDNPGAVEAFLTDEDNGLGARFEELLNNLTDVGTGLISRHNASLDTQMEIFNNRIEAIDLRVTSYEARLRRQFGAMEIVLARLQNQQSAINNFPTFTYYTNRNRNY